ncbi:MAG: Rab family GTPase [Candidatus Hodarchaeales archaeon]
MSAPTADQKLFKLKLPLLGDPAVGKTTLVKAFMGGSLTDRYSPTLGVEIGKKVISFEFEGKLFEVNYQLWDLAGQVTFKTIRSTYYRGASGIVLVYDISRYQTFLACEKWLEEAWGILGQVPVVLVGNKLDLRQQGKGEVSIEDGKDYAAKIQEGINLSTPFVEASALRARYADKPFKELARVILTQKLKQAE